MHDLPHISEQLYRLFQTGEVPEELHTGVALRCAVENDYCIQLRFQSQQQRWMLGVDGCSDSLDAAAQMRWRENLLRVGHASRWDIQQVGALDFDGRLSLVDCDFLDKQDAENITVQAIEGRLQQMLNKLAELQFSAEDDEALTGRAQLDAKF